MSNDSKTLMNKAMNQVISCEIAAIASYGLLTKYKDLNTLSTIEMKHVLRQLEKVQVASTKTFYILRELSTILSGDLDNEEQEKTEES